MPRQSDPTEPEAPEEPAKPRTELDVIFDEQTMETLLDGPAGDLWRAEWVATGLAKQPRDEDSEVPKRLRGWRRLGR